MTLTLGLGDLNMRMVEGGWGISTVRAGYCWDGHGDKTLELGAEEERKWEK